MDSESPTAASSPTRPRIVGQGPTPRARKDAYPPDEDMRLVQSAFHYMIENAKLQTFRSRKSQSSTLLHLALFIQPLTGPPTCLSSQELPPACKPYFPSIEHLLSLILQRSGWRSDLIIWENTTTIVIWQGAVLASLERFLQSQLEIQHCLRLRIVVPGGPDPRMGGYAESEESIPVFRLTCRGASTPPNEQFEGPPPTPQVALSEESGDDEANVQDGAENVEDETFDWQNSPPPTPPIIPLEELLDFDGENGIEDVEKDPDSSCQVREPSVDSALGDSFVFEPLEEEQILPQGPLTDESGTDTAVTSVPKHHHIETHPEPAALTKYSILSIEPVTSCVSLTPYLTVSTALSVIISTFLSSFIAFTHRQTFSFSFRDCFLTQTYPGREVFMGFTDTECRLLYLGARIQILVKVLRIWAFSFCSILLASVVVWLVLWVKNRWGDLIKERVWKRLGEAFEDALLDLILPVE